MKCTDCSSFDCSVTPEWLLFAISLFERFITHIHTYRSQWQNEIKTCQLCQVLFFILWGVGKFPSNINELFERTQSFFFNVESLLLNFQPLFFYSQSLFIHGVHFLVQVEQVNIFILALDFPLSFGFFFFHLNRKKIKRSCKYGCI